jgi:hypothetical protein
MDFFNKIKDILGLSNTLKNEFEKVINDSISEYVESNNDFWYIRIIDLKSYSEIVKNWNDEKKISFILYLVNRINNNYNKKSNYKIDFQEKQIINAYIQHLMRTKLNFKDEDIEILFNEFTEKTNQGWPIGLMINQISKQFKGNIISKNLEIILNKIKLYLKPISNNNFEKENIKFIEKIDTILFQSNNNEKNVKPTIFLGKDDFTCYANDIIQKKANDEKQFWYQLIAKAQKASGSKPSKKYLDEAKILIDSLGAEKFKKTTQNWFQFVINLKEKTETHSHIYNNTTYSHITYHFLSATNIVALKGFVWMNSLYYDNQTIQIISKLAERSFKKIPEKGPAAAAVGNACLFALYNSKGLNGIGQLSRLRLRIKQNNTLKLIENYIQEAANKLNITSDEIEDISVDDFKLEKGKRIYEFENYKCEIHVIGIGKSTLKWFKENGVEQKSVPTLIKDKYSAKLKKVKDTQKQIDRTTSAQRDRIDRMLRNDRLMSLSYFKEKYLQHPLLSLIADKIIFNFINSHKKIQAININGEWKDFYNIQIDIDEFQQVSLWHPVTSTTTEVKNWRDFLVQNKILQPFKQAFREIYLLTEAEIKTRTYSNRMASHILKQHQYVSLAKGRNWSSKLIGAWDGGDQDTAILNLPVYGLRAEYWVNALNVENDFNDAGIWNCVTTDQIRFVNTQNNEVIELINVPAIPFSEVLRDVDLFVGVASVGNDPTWQDSGGLPIYRDYWQSYSFGDLSEVAKNRKELLSNLIPRLKIAKVAAIENNFLVVKGKLRTYKIHIGSTNILMLPNDQYLCIVPDRSKKNVAENVFLPFEGDNGLSVILSKAFLLADDDKITDSSITSQIKR